MIQHKTIKLLAGGAIAVTIGFGFLASLDADSQSHGEVEKAVDSALKGSDIDVAAGRGKGHDFEKNPEHVMAFAFNPGAPLDVLQRITYFAYGAKDGTITRDAFCKFFTKLKKSYAGNSEWACQVKNFSQAYKLFLGEPPCGATDQGAMKSIEVKTLGNGRKQISFRLKHDGEAKNPSKFQFHARSRGEERDYTLDGEPVLDKDGKPDGTYEVAYEVGADVGAASALAAEALARRVKEAPKLGIDVEKDSVILALQQCSKKGNCFVGDSFVMDRGASGKGKITVNVPTGLPFPKRANVNFLSCAVYGVSGDKMVAAVKVKSPIGLVHDAFDSACN